MQIDIFKEILAPVLGGLGLFMLGLEFMSDGRVTAEKLGYVGLPASTVQKVQAALR